jgi:hypothetical protein
VRAALVSIGSMLAPKITVETAPAATWTSMATTLGRERSGHMG